MASEEILLQKFLPAFYQVDKDAHIPAHLMLAFYQKYISAVHIFDSLFNYVAP